MSQAQTFPATLQAQGRPRVSVAEQAVSVPLTIWFLVAGVALNVFSGLWDDAWHFSIGVDTTWAPPHILMQVSAILVSIACVRTVQTSTFAAGPSERDSSVRVLGLRAPGGVFITAWGCLATLVAGQFDNWWHQAYGDIATATPPHLLLLIGSIVTKLGGMAWIAGVINRSADELRGRLTWLFLFVCSAGARNLLELLPDFRGLHSSGSYLTFAVFIPSLLIAGGWGSKRRWGTTIIAVFYTGVALAAEWLLPLFPAQPKFGPVFHNITHLVPPGFPLLLIVPAALADILLRRLERQSSWLKSVWIGPGLVLSFFAVQWYFASFMMLPASRNWIFGTAYFAYRDPAGVLYDPYQFAASEKAGAFLLTMAIAVVASIMTTRLGLAWGDWFRRIRR